MKANTVNVKATTRTVARGLQAKFTQIDYACYLGTLPRGLKPTYMHLDNAAFLAQN